MLSRQDKNHYETAFIKFDSHCLELEEALANIAEDQ
jgi:hypothetical protein